MLLAPAGTPCATAHAQQRCGPLRAVTSDFPQQEPPARTGRACWGGLGACPHACMRACMHARTRARAAPPLRPT
eukprot:4431422-Alexandrium_andersonii.AAC.1